MIIKNQTKNIIISQNAEIADTFLKRFKGLMGKKDFEGKDGLLIESCNFIHTFFMKMPIDVIFVNKNSIVTKAYKNVRPGLILERCKYAVYVIELPANTIQDNINEGDRIILQ